MKKVTKEVREFFSAMGKKGGAISKRTISPEEQEKLQEARARSRERKKLEKELEDLRKIKKRDEKSPGLIKLSEKKRIRDLEFLLGKDVR